MANTPTITGSIPLYKSPEPLNATAHANLGVRKVENPLEFATRTNVVPVTIGEFGPASLCYPIIFAGGDKTPLAVMGLRKEENLYVNGKGLTDPDYYLPAFIRRYPFVFAEDKEKGNFVVCIDTGSDLISDKPDTPFFKDGKPTEFTENAIEFLKNFEGQRQASANFVKMLEELDLFEKKDVTVTNRNPDGSDAGSVKVADYFGVSEAKLNALPVDKLGELRQSGALMTIYVHLLSLMNWQRVIARAARMNAESAAV
jgi:hypothetical protein